MAKAPEQRNLTLILARSFASHLATAVFLLDAEGTVIYYNEAAERMRVHRGDDDVLYVVGELDRGTANLLATACRGSVGIVTIDLAEATFFDAGAHRAISRIAKSCKRVRLRNAPAIVQRVVFALQAEAGLQLEIEDDALSLRVG